MVCRELIIIKIGGWLTVLTVVKNPLSPVEHHGGVGVNNELFEESLEQFVVCYWCHIGFVLFLTVQQTRVLT